MNQSDGAIAPLTAGEGGATFSSGLPEEAQIADLTDQQFNHLCDTLYQYFFARFGGGGAPAFCRFVAVVGAGAKSPANDAALMSACQDSYDFCIATPLSPMSVMTLQTCPPRSAQCTATVSEFEKCYADEEIEQEDSWLALPDCSQLTLSQLPVHLPPPSAPASCGTYSSKCPP